MLQPFVSNVKFLELQGAGTATNAVSASISLIITAHGSTTASESRTTTHSCSSCLPSGSKLLPLDSLTSKVSFSSSSKQRISYAAIKYASTIAWTRIAQMSTCTLQVAPYASLSAAFISCSALFFCTLTAKTTWRTGPQTKDFPEKPRKWPRMKMRTAARLPLPCGVCQILIIVHFLIPFFPKIAKTLAPKHEKTRKRVAALIAGKWALIPQLCLRRNYTTIWPKGQRSSLVLIWSWATTLNLWRKRRLKILTIILVWWLLLHFRKVTQLW